MLSPSERDLIEVVHVREMNVRDEEHEEEKDGEDGGGVDASPRHPNLQRDSHLKNKHGRTRSTTSVSPSESATACWSA